MNDVLNESREMQIVDRLIMRLTSKATPSLCMLIEQLPLIFRVIAIESRLTENNRHEIITEIFHEQASLRVKWTADYVDARLKKGCLVSIRWKGQTLCEHGAIIISRLVLVDSPPNGLSIFETVPTDWVWDRSLIQRAIAIYNKLPNNYQRLINGVLWDQKRFWQFLNYPSSLNHHHAIPHGNLIHTIEVCELAQKVTLNDSVDLNRLTLLCFLHDIGKTDEYWYHEQHQRYYMSKRGQLLGHKLTALEWVVEAKNKYQIIITEREWLEILHGITSTQGIADWTGFRSPKTTESSLISMIDNLSVKQQ
ncbi:MAG: HD domain-containing protein [Betaproteobacteria bacterium]|nr:HD domain-containing protein [Betaproteobacteria bacterium]